MQQDPFHRTFNIISLNIAGLRLHDVTGGKGNPVLLLAGFPESWYAWRRVIPILAEHYTDPESGRAPLVRAFLVVVGDLVAQRAHGIAPHDPDVARPQQLGVFSASLQNLVQKRAVIREHGPSTMPLSPPFVQPR